MIRTRSLVLFATILASLFSPMPATAAVIFHNLVPDLTNAAYSDLDPTGPSGASQFADDFVLGSGQTTIRDIHWAGVYATANTPPATDNFTIFIFADSSGAPASTPLHTLVVADAGRQSTTDTVGLEEFDLFTYSVVTSPITLSAATTYWLSIVNTTATDADDNWAWATSSFGNAVRREPPAETWIASTVELSFILTDDVTGNDVPEPSTLLLLGSMLAGLTAWRRRRR